MQDKLPNTADNRVKKSHLDEHKLVIILASAVFFLVLLLILFIVLQIKLKKDLISKIEKEQKQTYQGQLIEEKSNIKKNLEEKYRADKVSFEAMKKRLDIEKQKTKELEEKLKDSQ